MKLLLINQFFWPDSAATAQLLTDVARSLSAKGAEVTVLCGRPDYGAVDESPAPPVRILRCGPAAFSRSKLQRISSYASFLMSAIWKAFRSERADVVVTLTTPPLLCLLGAALKLTRGSRHYIWEMDMYPDIALDLGVMRPGSLAWLVGATADWSRRRADGVVALGEDMKARLVARGIPGHWIHIAHNWADGSEIVPISFPEGPLVVHYSGNFGLAHDVETIAGAMKALQGNSDIRFVFAGGGSKKAWLEEYCRREAIPNASFPGYAQRADLGRSLGEGHIGLVTQLPQTCGAVVPSKTYGIMAAGRGILYVGPAAATPAQIIQRHECGWRVDSGDVTALVHLLETLLQDRSRIRRAGERARLAFDQHYERRIGVARVCAILGVPTKPELRSQQPVGELS